MTDNVIPFPREHRDAPPQTLDEMIAGVEKIRTEHIEVLLEIIIPEMADCFYRNGVMINDDSLLKHSGLVMESVKALLYKYYKLEHPFHAMVDEVFHIDIDSEDEIRYEYNLDNTEEE